VTKILQKFKHQTLFNIAVIPLLTLQEIRAFGAIPVATSQIPQVL